MAKKITADMLLNQTAAQSEQPQSPLAAYNDAYLFGGSAAPLIIKDGDKVEIEVSKLQPYKNQPFNLYNTDKMNDLAENIKENGVLNPLIVRPIENTSDYEILAGHNRAKAAELAGLDKVPCIVRYVDDEQAALILVDTNLQQRDEILPSERAFAYKLRLDAKKRQGKRTDLTSGQFGQKLGSRDELATEMGQSGKQIQRFIRLTYLFRPLLKLVDDKQIPVNAGVELSYMTEQHQEQLYYWLSAHGEKISIEQAKQFRAVSNVSDERLPEYKIAAIIDGTYIPPKPKAEPPIETAAPESEPERKPEPVREPEPIKPVPSPVPPALTVEDIPSAPAELSERKEKSPTTDTTVDDEIDVFTAKINLSHACRVIAELQKCSFFDDTDRFDFEEIADMLDEINHKYQKTFDEVK